MAAKKKRRTVSMSGKTYNRLRAYCEAKKVPMAALVEKLVAREMDAQGVDEVVAPPPTVVIEPDLGAQPCVPTSLQDRLAAACLRYGA